MDKVKETLLKLGSRAKQFLHKIFPPFLNFIKKHKVISIIILCVILIATALLFILGKKPAQQIPVTTEVTVQRQNIKEVISASSVLEPNAEYTITPLVTGEILSAPFEEGDKVEKGQLMYQFDTSDMETDIESAELNLKKAQKNYNDAVNSNAAQTNESNLKSSDISKQKAQKSYDDALSALDDLYIKADCSGIVSTVYVKIGDSVNNGTKIADVYDNSILKARIPFNSSDAEHIYVGDSAVITVTGTGSYIAGRVSEVSTADQSIAGRMMVRYITIEFENPGALMTGDKVTAMIGDMACNDVGTIENIKEKTITAKVSGTISDLSISSGDRVSSDFVVGIIESDSVETQLENAKLSLTEAELSNQRAILSAENNDPQDQIFSAKLALDEALLSKKKLQQKLDDYSITAPISGTVVTKNKKAGEEYEGAGGSSSSSGSSTSGIAVIYDMSSLCFTLDIDELEIGKVKTGQNVTITADASDKQYSGVVENVSVSGTVGNNGVTTYPIKVRLTDFDVTLLPGMNIEAEIVVSNAENILAIPVNALNRGNIVYVKGEKTDEKDRAPEGFHSVIVETGISDDSFIEITNGLSEGDIVYATPMVSGNMQQSMMMPPMGSMGGMGAMGGMGGMGGRMPSGGMSGGGMR